MYNVAHYRNLIDQILNENQSVPLTKGSQRVFNDKNLVSKLGETIKLDVKYNPDSFPQDIQKNFKKMSDEELARWFLESLDKIEKEGYLGVNYSSDGENSSWITKNYINDKHKWEDIVGTLNMNLSRWYYGRNNGLFHQVHNDLHKIDGIRKVGNILSYSYSQAFIDFEKAMLAKKMKKEIRASKIVDNDDYSIYITFNRAANINLGLGTNWCTANSSPGSNMFFNYAGKGLLFQLNPKVKVAFEKEKHGKKIVGNARYQFDQSGPYFMDLADEPVTPAFVLETFPYLYNDLVEALSAKKTEIQNYSDSCHNDPVLKKSTFGQCPEYNIDEEITKLKRFVDKGFMQETPRPPKEPELEAEPKVPALPPEN